MARNPNFPEKPKNFQKTFFDQLFHRCAIRIATLIMQILEKQNLRKHMRRILAEMSDCARRDASRNLWHLLTAQPQWQRADRLLAFAPFPEEPQILEDLLACGKTVALPRLCDRGLEFCEIASPSDLVAKPLPGSSTRVLSEPRASLLPILPQPTDLALVPGLAFTTDGARLGRGGGFYDRFLATFPGVAWGLCFARQILPTLPTEDHDVFMKLVIY